MTIKTWKVTAHKVGKSSKTFLINDPFASADLRAIEAEGYIIDEYCLETKYPKLVKPIEMKSKGPFLY